MLNYNIIFSALLLCLNRYSHCITFQVQTDEVFIIPLSPSLFNLSQTDFSGIYGLL